MVWYSVFGAQGRTTPADVIDLGFTPRDCEWGLSTGPDKFLGTNLEEKLKATRHFVSGGRYWRAVRCGTARLQCNRAGRLPVIGRSLYGAVRDLASLQRRTSGRHPPSDFDS